MVRPKGVNGELVVLCSLLCEVRLLVCSLIDALFSVLFWVDSEKRTLSDGWCDTMLVSFEDGALDFGLVNIATGRR
jgi:hypothetical protein